MPIYCREIDSITNTSRRYYDFGHDDGRDDYYLRLSDIERGHQWPMRHQARNMPSNDTELLA